MLAGLSVYFIVALIVIIILYWCAMYTRVFSTESHPRIRLVARLYKWLLAVFLVVEISCRIVYSEVESYRVVLTLHSLFVTFCCAVTAIGFLYFGRRHYRQIMSTAHGGVFRSRLERVHFLTTTASILLLITLFSVLLLGVIGMTASLLQHPRFYVVQQSIYRLLQFIYCAFILVSLRTPPEIQSRAVYTAILD